VVNKRENQTIRKAKKEEGEGKKRVAWPSGTEEVRLTNSYGGRRRGGEGGGFFPQI